MTPLAMAISRALIHFVWQGLVVGLVLGMILAALRKRSANCRYIVSCAALGVMAVMPVVTTLFLYSRRMAADSGLAAPTPISHAIAAVSAGSQFQVGWLAALQMWALPAWSLGVLLCSLRLVLGYNHAFMLGRRGKPA